MLEGAERRQEMLSKRNLNLLKDLKDAAHGDVGESLGEIWENSQVVWEASDWWTKEESTHQDGGRDLHGAQVA